MAVIFELPEALEQRLRQQVGNLEAAAKEAVVVELFRQGKLTLDELAQVLGLDRQATSALLSRHGVPGGESAAGEGDHPASDRLRAFREWVAKVPRRPGPPVDASRTRIYEE